MTMTDPRNDVFQVPQQPASFSMDSESPKPELTAESLRVAREEQLGEALTAALQAADPGAFVPRPPEVQPVNPDIVELRTITNTLMELRKADYEAATPSTFGVKLRTTPFESLTPQEQARVIGGYINEEAKLSEQLFTDIKEKPNNETWQFYEMNGGFYWARFRHEDLRARIRAPYRLTHYTLFDHGAERSEGLSHMPAHPQELKAVVAQAHLLQELVAQKMYWREQLTTPRHRA